ncbi:Rpn family recombination-promoting nuclease/putative transposase, partial [Fretibacterium sp. OH1220_COT-178]|uniref:Rpn family recombination-promoting nuclease/putative transposase n=1 Tax=Fretibacterium sp. OH1220_COT-178 TaxID=2491047 RepID=UPI000F5FD342
MALRDDEVFRVSDRELEACIRMSNPLNDALFKYLFASKENKENLLRLLNDTLGPERCIVDVEYLDRESDARRFEGRSSFVDVLARSEDGRVFHVEVQLLDEGYFFERVAYYAACSLADQLSKGDGYECLRPVVFVSLLRYELFPGRPETWRSVHRVLDVEDHRCYNDLLEFQFFELPKLERLFGAGFLGGEKETGLERLLRYLGRIGGDEEMERLAEQDPGIERLRKGERSFFRTPGNLASYRMHERAETDYRNALRYREAKARMEGEARGEARGEA